MISELDGVMENFSGNLDSASSHPIKETLKVNAFMSYLQIRLIPKKHLEWFQKWA